MGRRDDGTGVGAGSRPWVLRKSGVTWERERASQRELSSPRMCRALKMILLFISSRISGLRSDIIFSSLLVWVFRM